MKQNLKIGILSDSHRESKLHQEAITHLINSGAEYLLHAGDLEIKEHLDMLESTKLPYICVYGNNDTLLIPLYGQYPIYREPHYFDIEGIKIKMMHMPYYLNSDADIVISGHTHIFEAEMRNNTLFINPGEVCAREKYLSECVILEISDGVFELMYYFRKPNSKEWQSRNIILLM
jgi:putative phosphoesterase